MEFLRSFLRLQFAGKPLVASQNVICFLRLEKSELLPSISTVSMGFPANEMFDMLNPATHVHCSWCYLQNSEARAILPL